MRHDQQIRINGLLLQREELFVRVHECERAIEALLDKPYPFARPTLPSDRRGKRKPGPARAAAKDPLRPLEASEQAYRVTYLRAGQTGREDHDDLAALRTLLASQGTDLRVTRIETIDAGGRVKSVLLGQ